MKTKGKLFLSVALSSLPAGKPVVFWDTCAILELMRLPERANNPGRDFDQYEYLADKINAGEIISVTSELVFQEFNQHYKEELTALRRHEQKMRLEIKKISSIMKSGAKRLRIENAVDSMHTELRVTSTISKIWRNTILIREQKSFLQFAYIRVKFKMAPSLNKEQFKDSYIWGTFLSFAHGLMAGTKLFFYTLNKSDYLDSNTKKLCPHIVTDLSMLPDVEVHTVLGSLYGVIYKLIP